MPEPFNPLDKIHLGESIREALLRQDARPLSNRNQFDGAGIYAIYYVGTYPAYELIAEKNAGGRFELPIYVGKAVPAGARKGGLLGNAPTTALAKRIREHANTIAEAENLTLEDFYVRHLVVDDIWIPLGETLLIHSFAPVWNKIVNGFGNHTPGKGRNKQCVSAWDMLHPGRMWVNNLGLPLNPQSQRQWIEHVRKYLLLPREVQASVPTVETGDES